VQKERINWKKTQQAHQGATGECQALQEEKEVKNVY
jgi:hypothetical protein